MIRHLVMWRVQGDTPDERLASSLRVKHEFESLRDAVDGLLHIEVGIDSSRVDYACDVALVADFASSQALAAYATHPAHMRVRERLGELRTARFQVDYEVGERTADTAHELHASERDDVRA
jgi:hypothetical protein